MTWRFFLGGVLFLVYAVSNSLKKKTKKVNDVKAELPRHPLAPFLQNLNQAVKELADGLNEQKLAEKPKGKVSRIYHWLGAAWSKTLKAITATRWLALLLGGLWQQYRSSDDVMLEYFKVPSDLEKAGYSPEVVAMKLADNIKLISDNAVSNVGSNIGVRATTSVGGSKGGVTTRRASLGYRLSPSPRRSRRST